MPSLAHRLPFAVSCLVNSVKPVPAARHSNPHHHHRFRSAVAVRSSIWSIRPGVEVFLADHPARAALGCTGADEDRCALGHRQCCDIGGKGNQAKHRQSLGAHDQKASHPDLLTAQRPSWPAPQGGKQLLRGCSGLAASTQTHRRASIVSECIAARICHGGACLLRNQRGGGGCPSKPQRSVATRSASPAATIAIRSAIELGFSLPIAVSSGRHRRAHSGKRPLFC